MKNTIKEPENELKYTINEGAPQKHIMLWQLLSILRDNGFNLCLTDIEKKTISDDYYDTSNMDLLKSGGSLRTRKIQMGDTKKVKGTYKKPVESESVYSAREEFEEPLKRDSFNYLRKAMNETDADIDFDMIVDTPILNVTTERSEALLEKGGVLISLALDESVYTNYKLNSPPVYDGMLEIEAKGDPRILNEVHAIFFPTSPSFKPYKGYHKITPTKQSKYSRGINMTMELSPSFRPEESYTDKDIEFGKVY